MDVGNSPSTHASDFLENSSEHPRIEADAACHPGGVRKTSPTSRPVAETLPLPEQRTSKAAAAPAAPAKSPLDLAIDALIIGRNSDPFALLGPHNIETPSGHRWVIRAFHPGAISATVRFTDSRTTIEANKLRPEGFFEATLPETQQDRPAPASYRIQYRFASGATHEQYDTYAFPFVLSEFDLYLMGEGRHYDTYDKLGAHIVTLAGVRGANFAVWAPSAQRVSVAGDFNQWDGRIHPMRARGSSGVWELFIPELGEGAIYKYEIIGPNGNLVPLKADPYAFRAEVRPQTGSIVADLDAYKWSDGQWMTQRSQTNWLEKPISIYEVHLGGWRRVLEENSRWLTYRELGDQLIPYVKDLGYSHIELLPIMEHPFDGSWGYQTIGYFAATSRYGSPADFMEFIDRCHNAGLGVLLDWTPAHFPRDTHGLAEFDGTHLYEHSDPRQGAHPDWGTLVYNYGRNEVQNYLISNALFWLDKYHIDGLRVDAVASMLYLDYSRKPGEWVPNQFGGRENLPAIAFLRRLNEVAYERFPGLLTKMPGDMWQQFANLRLLYAYQYGHPGKKLLFMGQEFGQRSEFSEARSLDWHLLQYDSHRGIQRLIADLNKLYAAEPALHEVDFDWHGFEWLDCNDADNSVFSFMRRGKNPQDLLLVVLNATPVVRPGYRIGVPQPGFYQEVLNTDSATYGGSNAGNMGGAQSAPMPQMGRPHSIALTLPPLAATFLKWLPS